jgi:hypothetical protein
VVLLKITPAHYPSSAVILPHDALMRPATHRMIRAHLYDHIGGKKFHCRIRAAFHFQPDFCTQTKAID